MKYWVLVLLIFIFSAVIADARIDYTVVPRLSIEGGFLIIIIIGERLFRKSMMLC